MGHGYCEARDCERNLPRQSLIPAVRRGRRSSRSVESAPPAFVHRLSAPAECNVATSIPLNEGLDTVRESSAQLTVPARYVRCRSPFLLPFRSELESPPRRSRPGMLGSYLLFVGKVESAADQRRFGGPASSAVLLRLHLSIEGHIGTSHGTPDGLPHSCGRCDFPSRTVTGPWSVDLNRQVRGVTKCVD